MTTNQDNSEQRDAWNGTTGESWSTYQDALDRMLQAVSGKLFTAANLKPGDHVLDIGCGCGPTSIAAARIVGPEGEVTGVDISGILLKSARERSSDLGLNVSFVEADASVQAFSAKFDKIISRFGVMFFADPIAAFENLHSALKPNGRLAFVCWRTFQENPWMGEVVAEAAKIVPMPPPPPGPVPGPFAFGDRGYLESVLKSAGFKSIEIEGFEPVLRTPGDTLDERCAFYMRIGPMAGLMREATEDQRRQLEATLRRWVEDGMAAGRNAQNGACWLVRAAA